MSAVGVMSILVGVVVLFSRGALLLAPAATLRGFESLISSHGRTRALGAFVVVLGAAMGWAGASEPSGLAAVLSVIGWGAVAIGTVALVLFPNLYRSLGRAVLPSVAGADLIGWRVVGFVGVVIGGVLVYFGVLAL